MRTCCSLLQVQSCVSCVSGVNLLFKVAVQDCFDARQASLCILCLIGVCDATVPSARRAQTLIMPGTLPVHQTSDELLASTSDAMAHDISGSSISSSSDKSALHTGATHVGSSISEDIGTSHSSHSGSRGSSSSSSSSGGSSSGSSSGHAASSQSGTSTVRMGKMLDAPRARSNAHHHASSSGR